MLFAYFIRMRWIMGLFFILSSTASFGQNLAGVKMATQVSSLGLGDIKWVVNSVKFDAPVLHQVRVDARVVQKERQSLADRRIRVEQVTGVDEVVQAIKMNQHGVYLSLDF